MNEDPDLRRAYEELPKTEMHGVSAVERHPEIRPEWVIRIMYEPYDRIEEHRAETFMTILVGRVPEVNQWIKLVFIGNPETGLFHTAYMDRRLSGRYGGRPWRNE